MVRVHCSAAATSCHYSDFASIVATFTTQRVICLRRTERLDSIHRMKLQLVWIQQTGVLIDCMGPPAHARIEDTHGVCTTHASAVRSTAATTVH